MTAIVPGEGPPAAGSTTRLDRRSAVLQRAEAVRQAVAAVRRTGAGDGRASRSERPHRHLLSPHRRGATPPRFVERSAVLSYRLTAWLIAHVPAVLARSVIGLAAQGSYLLWPAKRRWSNANFAHVLGTSPDDPAVRALALSAYRTYARYLVELMRLPRLSMNDVGQLADTPGLEDVADAWRNSPKGLIVSAAHIGNNEAVAAGIARHGFPIAAVADDTSFPELFDLLKRQREGWGLTLIPWRNLRDIYTILRRSEILALLVDWGYRRDGIPVRLFGAWTTLPAGPAVLAAKTGAPILPIASRRMKDGRFRVEVQDLVHVESSDPAAIQRATQALADALERTVRAAPEQWYSFKPMWPPNAAQAAELERRAEAMLAGRRSPLAGAEPA